jgi:hypothetical protein
MLTLHIDSITAWSDYFTGSPTLYNSTLYGSRHTPSDTNVHVSNCLFRSCSSSGNGGALYCYGSATCLLVESTSFFSCTTSSQNGGAIYFYHGSGQCVLHEVCGFNCYSTYASSSSYYSYQQFAYICVYNTNTNKNYINYSSIVRCVNERSYSYYTFSLHSGKNCLPSINCSMNKCYRRLFYCNPYCDSNSVTCSFSYSTFADNYATDYVCFFLWTTAANFEMKSCNIIRNAQGTLSSVGTFHTCGYLTIEDSCILENKANCILFSNNGYPMTLSNCTVDSATNNGYLTIKNTVTKSFILALNHMSTLNCHSEYDAAGYLTPITAPPPSPTKQRICYTYREFFIKSRLIDLVSLIYVLLFMFIHLDGSSNPLY